MKIYNLKGQNVATIMNAYLSEGEYKSKWDGKDDSGKYVASGTYFIRLIEDDEKILLNRFMFIK